jgi:hypothetical protein
MRTFWAILALCFIVSEPHAAFAQAGGNAFSITATTVKTPPVIDGSLSDPQWKNAAHVRLEWDYSFRRPAEETTDAYLLADAGYIYVAFVAKQREPITATQRIDDQPLDADDAVGVYFWPAGESGNEYGFIANPAGTRYAISGENSAFSPSWDAVAKISNGMYVVTERIPVGVMRGDGRSLWRVQFDRRIRTSNQTMEWAHNPAQNSTDQNIYAGYLGGMQIAAKNARTKPRLAVYGLGEIAPASLGGSTSRAGADLAIPITQTSSFIATFHPDYSNVELDQQTIAPTAFPRRFSEVRPFFTQGGKDYNRFSCNDCVGWPLLYTPKIPTPRMGYAVEGIQGQYTFDAFDAVGSSRSDTAQTIGWSSPDTRYGITYQRTGVDMPDFHDVAQYGQVRVGNAHNFGVYLTKGNESGSTVTLPAGGRYDEYGVNFYDAHSAIYAAYHDVGEQYAPADAFNDLFGVHGPSVFMQHTFQNGAKAFVQSLSVEHDFQRFRDHQGVPNYGVDESKLTLTTRTQWTLSLSAGHTFLRFPTTPGGYTNQNGMYLAYGANTSTPSSITYNIGRFGGGFLRSTDLQTSWRVTPTGTLSLEAFRTDQTLDAGGRLEQWLERAGFAYQLGRGQSVAIGWRRIIGTGPSFFDVPQFIDATNFSFAYYRRMHGAELYFAYGTPNTLSTQHDVLLKIIRYIGAEKGT